MKAPSVVTGITMALLGLCAALTFDDARNYKRIDRLGYSNMQLADKAIVLAIDRDNAIKERDQHKAAAAELFTQVKRYENEARETVIVLAQRAEKIAKEQGLDIAILHLLITQAQAGDSAALDKIPNEIAKLTAQSIAWREFKNPDLER